MKEILFIAPTFYKYERSIKKELEGLGYTVFFENEVPFGDLYYITQRVCKRISNYLLSMHEKRLIDYLYKNNIKKIFIIRGFGLTNSFLQVAKSKNISIVYYQWDSVRNNPNAKIICSFADYNFTFDHIDAKKYGYMYLPLFYDWEERDLPVVEQKYDVSMVGSWSYERFKIFSEIRRICKNNGLSLNCYLYIPIQSYIRRILHGEKIPHSIVKFRPLSRKRYLKMLLMSNVILDVPSPSQTGSTMRTIETLSLRKKIVTTNRHVMNESFYDTNNIFCYPIEKRDLVEFLTNNFNSSSNVGIRSLKEWLKSLGF